ncbi:ABC transporter permease [Sinosporangium siamense]|uniref:ABC transporter permease n=1 Tax=Sinosporangium siamense TaxID=1367973 RepID=A0A919RNF3_9ACTN|nr:ABC transporter permease [Sinosporangium siamense]GII95411.1 ABC transporter permease [Sinosporangium siamense]
MSQIAGQAPPAAAPRKRRRLGVSVVLCLAVLIPIVISAVFGSAIAPHDPALQDPTLGALAPNGTYWLGTDDLGRDIFSRLIAGAYTAVAGPLLVALGTTLTGTVIGLLAAYRGGWFDTVAMRGVDLMYALPAMLVLIIAVGVLGGGYYVAVVLLIFLTVPTNIRLVRSAALSQKEMAYVESARVMGLSPARIIGVHILPNVSPTVVTNFLLDFVGALVGLSGLSFLGLGVPAGTADWGLMLAENRAIMDLNPMAIVAPAALITLTATAATVLADAAYKRISQAGAQRD